MASADLVKPVGFHTGNMEEYSSDAVPVGDWLPNDSILGNVAQSLAPIRCTVVQHRQEQTYLNVQSLTGYNITRLFIENSSPSRMAFRFYLARD